MAKYDLLTVLTLKAAGFKAGIDDAKKSTKSLVDGTKQAQGAIAGAFGSIAGLAGGATGQLSGITSAVMGGTKAFMAMIPAIGSVSTALIASGIGAVIVGIGLAVAALMSYFKGTAEGAGKLKDALAVVSGVANTLIQRFKHLGAAIAALFDRDWTKMASEMKAAFAGGFIEEANKNAKYSLEIAKQARQLAADKTAFIVEEAQMKDKIAELDYNARNEDEATKEGFANKKKYLLEEIGLIRQMYNKKQDFAARDVAMYIQNLQAKYGNDYMSIALRDEKNELANLQATYIQLGTEATEAITSKQRQLKRINTGIAKEETVAYKRTAENIKGLQALEEIAYEMDLQKSKENAKSKEETDIIEINDWKQKEIEKVLAVEGSSKEILDIQKQLIDDINDYAVVKIQVVYQKSIDEAIANDLNAPSEDVATPDSVTDYGKQTADWSKKMSDDKTTQYQKDIKELDDALAKQHITKEYYAKKAAELTKAEQLDKRKAFADTFSAYAQQASNLANIISSFQEASMNKELEAAGNNEAKKDEIRKKYAEKQKQAAIVQAIINGAVGITQAFAQGGILGFITGGIVAAGVAAQIAVINSQGFTNGGVVSGSSFSGDKVNVRVNSGERVLTAKQNAVFESMVYNGKGGSSNGGEVTFKIKGTELVGVLNNQSRKTSNTK